MAGPVGRRGDDDRRMHGAGPRKSSAAPPSLGYCTVTVIVSTNPSGGQVAVMV
jgi:hypothetical protein